MRMQSQYGRHLQSQLEDMWLLLPVCFRVTTSIVRPGGSSRFFGSRTQGQDGHHISHKSVCGVTTAESSVTSQSQRTLHYDGGDESPPRPKANARTQYYLTVESLIDLVRWPPRRHSLGIILRSIRCHEYLLNLVAAINNRLSGPLTPCNPAPEGPSKQQDCEIGLRLRRASFCRKLLQVKW